MQVMPRTRQAKFTNLVANTAKQNGAPMLQQPRKWRGKAKVVVAKSPVQPAAKNKKPTRTEKKKKEEQELKEQNLRQQKRKRAADDGDGDEPGSKAAASTSQRLGDVEFDRQLQMALLATSEDAKKGDARNAGGAAAPTSSGGGACSWRGCSCGTSAFHEHVLGGGILWVAGHGRMAACRWAVGELSLIHI